MAHLVLISIGPVQGFIAAARKARDLWFGSTMLSVISHAVASSLVNDFGAEVIFPTASALQSDAAVANKILAIVDGHSPSQVAAHARSVVQARLVRYREELHDELLRRLGPDLPRAVDEELIARQVDQLAEFASAWVTFDPGRPEQYPLARDQVEWLLAARKMVRDFAPSDGPDGVLKSSLDPTRESVLRPAAYQRRAGARELIATLHVGRGEQLDGISLIKRLGGHKRFLSIARVAVDPFIRRVQHEPELSDLLRAARRLDERQSDVASWFDTAPGSGLEQYAAFPYETQLFYDQTDDELDAGDAVHSERFRTIVRGLSRRLAIDELPAYFAVLAADGDSVGELISSLHTPRHHQELSDAMVGFATDARAITVAHQGALIYGGGDDVLAFLPLDRVLDCADALRNAFVRHVGPAAIGGGQVSLSVGVSIGHHSEHLQNLLGWARAAEQAAKQYTGVRPKNALAVALHTRTGGGSELTVVHSWDDDPVRTCWQCWMALNRADVIPEGAAYELSALAREFRDLDADAAALRDEARRILSHKRGSQGGDAVAAAETDAILNRIGDTPMGLRLLASELIIAGRIRSAVDVAEGHLTGNRVRVGAS